MNVISCENCGTMMNKDRIKISDEIYDLDPLYEEDREKSKYYYDWDSNNNEWSLYIKCPACKTKIFFNTGEKV